MADINIITNLQTRPPAATPAENGEQLVGLNAGDLATMIDRLGSATTGGRGPVPPRSSAAPHVLEAAIAKFNRSVNFRVDQETGDPVITIRDRATGETIRQIPSDTFLALSKRMDDMRGILFEKVA